MSAFKELCEELVLEIQKSYTEGVTVEEAEKLAGKFLYAQIQVAEELRVSDLDTRTKKSGLKAIKAAVYMEAATKDPKKPSDTLLDQLVTMNEIVVGEQQRFDEAEVLKNHLEHYMNIFRDGHIHFRGIAKGAFGG